MENFGVSLNKIKQPAPDVAAASETKRAINRPYVGIISDINPTTTPISDTLVLKGQEVPRSRFQPAQIRRGLANFDNIATGGILACGILAILSLFRKK